MKLLVDTLRELGTGQRVRLTFEDSSTIEMRVNQNEYTPGDCLRLELTGVDPNDGRYRLETHVENGGWTPPTVQRYDRESGAWATLEEVTDVAPLGTFQTMKSDDMKAQESTETGAKQGPQ